MGFVTLYMPPKIGPRLPNGAFARRGRKPGTKVTKKVVANTVERAINRTLETKFVSADNLSNINFNSGITSAATEFYSLIPSITRGNGSWQLLDNSLKPLMIKTTWHIGLASVSRSQNLVVDLYLLQNKNVKTYPSLVGTSPAFLKQGQSGEIQNYNGYIQDGNQPINTALFTLLKHYRIHLASNVGLSNGDTTSGNAPNIGGNMSYRRITYTYKHKSPLKYTPGSGTGPIYPNNTAPFWCLGYSKIDGSNPDVAQQNVTVTTNCQMFYKDA